MSSESARNVRPQTVLLAFFLLTFVAVSRRISAEIVPNDDVNISWDRGVVVEDGFTQQLSNAENNNESKNDDDQIREIAEEIGAGCNNQSSATTQLASLHQLNATVASVLEYLDGKVSPPPTVAVANPNTAKNAASSSTSDGAGAHRRPPSIPELLQLLTQQSQTVFKDLLCLPENSPPYAPLDLFKLFRGQSPYAVRAAVHALGEIVEKLMSIIGRRLSLVEQQQETTIE